MKIYTFDGKKISSANATSLIGKTFFVKNSLEIVTYTDIMGNNSEPEKIIKVKIGKKTSSEWLQLLYEHRGWSDHGDEYCDLDDMVECSSICEKILNQDCVQEMLLFCYREQDVNKYAIEQAVNVGLKPNRMLVEVKLLGVDKPLHYITSDLSLMKGDIVVVTEGNFYTKRGRITKALCRYYEYFGESNLSDYFYAYYNLYFVKRETDYEKFELEKDLAKNPIKYKPSNYKNFNDSKNYLIVNICDVVPKNYIISCTSDKEIIKKAIVRLTNAYKTKNDEYNDIQRYCKFYRNVSFKSLSNFVIYATTCYYNLGLLMAKDSVSFESFDVYC